MTNQKLIQSQSGRTMLEMLGVLGIMGIIMYGAIAGINYGMSTYKVNQAYNEVQEGMQAIQDLYSWSRCYPSGDFTVKLAGNDVFPSDTNAFGGPINVEGDGAACEDGYVESFKMIYPVNDSAAINRLNEMEWGEIEMTIDGNNAIFKYKED